MKQCQQPHDDEASKASPTSEAPEAKDKAGKSLFKRLLAWLIKGAEANAASGACST